MRHYFQDQSIQLAKKERTRALLIDGAIAAVAKHGLEGTSIKEITTLAGVSNGTYYNYFKTRDEALRLASKSIAEEVTNDIAQSVAILPSGLGRIVVSTLSFIDRLVKAPEWGALIVDVVYQLTDVRKIVGGHLQEDVALAIKQGDLAEMPSPFTIHQIATLIALGIEMQIKGAQGPDVAVQTSISVLQLLGLTPTKARNTVAKYQSKVANSRLYISR
ncbi:MAG: TetR/AcrR family transcriptional regulator [Alphaproteobacteria bacterium]